LYIPDEILYIDITSISLYSSEIEGSDFGYNRDGENLRQINICLLLGKKCGMPLMFRVLPGKINDVASLITTLRHSFALGSKKLSLILDRGFFSFDNISYMLNNKVDFIIAVSPHISWIDKIIDAWFDDLMLPENYTKISKDDTYFALTVDYTWKNPKRKLSLHIYFSRKVKVSEYEKFMEELKDAKTAIEKGKYEKRKHSRLLKYFNIN
jgi:transposase